jgi:hypothetical protein
MGGYFTFDEMVIILEWMRDQYPNIITKLDTIGNFTTINGNPIYYLKVSDNPAIDEDEEPQVLYTALHHAREPNSLSQMIFYLWYLLENYNKDEEIKYLIDNTEMYFIPCVNPDGYIINEQNKPNGGGLWRKNGWKDANGNLKGVDLNRNYGYEWGFDNQGSSNNVNSETYRGASAFSEIETQAVKYLCEQKNFSIGLNYHTFGNYLIHPWGYSDVPTQDEAIFKRMGSIMTEENQFVLGTGTETVGYTTNGDSDDYMYGEQTSKNKIFSFTPEVGYSFWPVKADIDRLNKSCIQLNLSLPRLVNGVIDHTIMNADHILSHFDNKIRMQYHNPGLKTKSASIELKLLTPEQKVLKTDILTLDAGQTMEDTFDLSFDINQLHTGLNNIRVLVTKDYGSHRIQDTIIFSFYNGVKEIVFSDNGNDLSYWTSNGNWGNSFTEYVSAPSSITDSPLKLYGNNTFNTLELFQGLDLTQGKSPILRFKAKWNIENNYDYAAIYAYVPGEDKVRLCGNYTNLGTLDQIINEPIYDGTQREWVEEIISLQDFEGRDNVYISIELKSDANLEMDGIYIDDIEVYVYTPLNTNTNNIDFPTTGIYPNPTDGNISFRNKIDYAEMYDLNGKKIWSANISNNHVNVNKLDNGLYIVKSYYNNILVGNTKLIIIK